MGFDGVDCKAMQLTDGTLPCAKAVMISSQHFGIIGAAKRGNYALLLAEASWSHKCGDKLRT